MSASPFYTYRQYLIDTYGHRVYRVPINLNFSCPHRRPDGTGGCSFCPTDGAHSMQTPRTADLNAQIQAGITFARERYDVHHFMAYIQAYTGTHANPVQQARQYDTILNAYPFESIAIGTRPDCLPDSTLDLLSNMKSKLDVIIELGIQTIHDDLLERINRGHNWATSENAIHALHQRGIRILAHVILGLPGTTPERDRQTAKKLAQLPLDGVKLHNLHVIKHTPLAEDYRQNPFPLMDEQEYAERLIDFIRHLPPHMTIARIRTDTPADQLIAPQWQLKKGSFLHMVEKQMRREHIQQGDRFHPAPPSGVWP